MSVEKKDLVGKIRKLTQLRKEFDQAEAALRQFLYEETTVCYWGGLTQGSDSLLNKLKLELADEVTNE